VIQNNLFLGITTTEDETGIAVVSGKNVLWIRLDIIPSAEIPSQVSQQNETLFDFIKQALTELSCEIKDLSGIGIVIGPGKFTSLRVGLACAKGLALPYNIKLKGMGTLEALVYSVLATGVQNEAIIVPVIDIRRGEVYYQIYKGTLPISAPKISFPNEFVKDLPENSILVGSGVIRYKNLIQEGAAVSYVISEVRCPNPVMVAQYAQKAILAGEFDDPDSLVPVYLRDV
jgi:tRNA threonylcarbamoyladenosine biosynthesis protein TsaB